MKKFFGVALAVVLLSTVTFAAPGAKPKATGDADWINGEAFDQPANLTFNAINTDVAKGLAKGSAIYSDANITYTMDVQFLKVDKNIAWFAGQVTSVTAAGDSQGCCKAGYWIFLKVVDNGEPGTLDEVSGEDLTAGKGILDGAVAANLVMTMANPDSAPFVLTGGNIQVR